MRTRYVALSVIPLAMLVAGLAALAAPKSPAIPVTGATPTVLVPGGLLPAVLRLPLTGAEAIGLALLAGAILATWALAFAWEVDRRRRARR